LYHHLLKADVGIYEYQPKVLRDRLILVCGITI